MPTEKEICSLALARIGQYAPIESLADRDTYAALAKSQYPIIRDTLVAKHAWNFATVIKKLSPIDGETNGWRFAYKTPSDCVRAMAVTTDGDKYFEGNYDWESGYDGSYRLIYTDCENAVLKYVASQTVTDMFSPLFTDALIWHLAASLSGPIIKGDTGMSVAGTIIKFALEAERRAILTDTKERASKRLHYTPAWYKD